MTVGVFDGIHLGYPTANLTLQNEALPPNDAYAIRARISRERLGGIVNVSAPSTCKGGQG
jgi:FAD synthase